MDNPKFELNEYVYAIEKAFNDLYPKTIEGEIYAISTESYTDNEQSYTKIKYDICTDIDCNDHGQEYNVLSFGIKEDNIFFTRKECETVYDQLIASEIENLKAKMKVLEDLK